MTPPDETLASKTIHVYIPFALSLIVVILSLLTDLLHINEIFWFQRSGAVLAATGVYIAFHETKNFFRTMENENGEISAVIDPEISYKWIALACAILGTAIWGYGDIFFKVT